MMNNLPSEILERVIEDIHSDTPEGYRAFYELIWNRPVPEHVLDDWVRPIYGEKTQDRPIFLEAFRGSTKSTSITVTFLAYKIGLYPTKTSYIVNAVDEKANEFAEAVRDIIEHNVGWKIAFPNVVPDNERGWSQDGYCVKDTTVEYGEWVRKLSPDPTFVGYGYTSGSINGKHPSLLLIVDDIHNDENTRSGLEIQAVKSVYNSVITYTRVPNNPTLIVVGTPWVDNDLYGDIKASGAYFHIRTPARRPDKTPTWPEGMGEEAIAKAEREDLTGGVDSARALHLDLTAHKKREIVYHSYPSHLISLAWPTYGGGDPAGVADPTKRNSKQSHFGLAYVMQTPENYAAVYDGVLEQVSMGEALDYIDKAQSLFPNWQLCEVEGDGKGEEFYQACMLKPHLKVVMDKTGGKSKPHRIVNLLGPWLRIGKVRLSDASTKFLNAARNFANKYPNVTEEDPGWDAWDAIYRAVHLMPHVLILEQRRSEIQKPSEKMTRRGENPWSALAKRQEYA